jgi:hypothetical protein
MTTHEHKQAELAVRLYRENAELVQLVRDLLNCSEYAVPFYDYGPTESDELKAILARAEELLKRLEKEEAIA